jgi:FixJ family two-component response regulator
MNGPPIRVAVVDDDRSVRNALRRLLTTTGFQAGTFESGSEFLESLFEEPPDCLILDLNMPGMTGRELMRRVLQQVPDLPVIFMTAVDNPEARAEFDILGATAYLPKPVEAHELIAAIGSALKIAHLDFDDIIQNPDLDQSPIDIPRQADS